MGGGRWEARPNAPDEVQGEVLNEGDNPRHAIERIRDAVRISKALLAMSAVDVACGVGHVGGVVVGALVV